MVCPNFPQKIIVIGTPSMACAGNTPESEKSPYREAPYAVSAYGTAAHGIVKAVIKDIPLEDNDRDIHEQTATKYNPTAVGAKRIGTSMTVIVTFSRKKSPDMCTTATHYVNAVSITSKLKCAKVAARWATTVASAPRPTQKVCLACGTPHPRDGHRCVLKSKLCGVGRPTGDKTCKARYKIPYVVRKHQWECRQAEAEQCMCDLSPGSMQHQATEWRR